MHTGQDHHHRPRSVNFKQSQYSVGEARRHSGPSGSNASPTTNTEPFSHSAQALSTQHSLPSTRRWSSPRQWHRATSLSEIFESQWPIPSAHPPSTLMSKNASRADLRPCAPPHPHSRAVASRATLLRSVRSIRSGTHARLVRLRARESEGAKCGQLVSGVRVL